MSFRDLQEFLSTPPIELPVRGKVYAFPGPGSISMKTWLRLTKMFSDAADAEDEAELLTDEEDIAIEAELLGDVKQQMIDDGCTLAELQAVKMTLVAWHLNGRDLAEAVWNAQGEAPALNREQRRARSQGSPGTSNGAKPKPASPGRKSSGTGR